MENAVIGLLIMAVFIFGFYMAGRFNRYLDEFRGKNRNP